MFPASFSLSPIVLVLLHLSDPARSHSDNLVEQISIVRAMSFQVWPLSWIDCLPCVVEQVIYSEYIPPQSIYLVIVFHIHQATINKDSLSK